MTTVADDQAGLDELRARVTEELKGLLTVRTADSRGAVLGAGLGDLEPGRRYLQLLDAGGYLTPAWPVGHGGMGLGPSEADVVREVVAGFEAPDTYPFMVGLDLVGPTVLIHGTEAQAARWLPPIRRGEEIWCQLFSEPDAGSDLANLKARVVRDGDSWRLNGSKVWTSRGHYSQWGLLLARSDGSVAKHRGITAFGLDLRTPGVTVRPLVQMNGDTHFNEVFFDDVVIPDGDRLGGEGEGWRVAMTCLSHERSALAGNALGVSLDQLLALGRTPGVADHPVRRDRLVRSLVALRVIDWTVQRARATGLEGAGSLTKLASNAMIKQVASLGLEAFGPDSLVADGAGAEWRTMFQVSPSLSIRGGTDEIQRNILGERVLGLPGEPRVDKDRPFDERPDR